MSPIFSREPALFWGAVGTVLIGLVEIVHPFGPEQEAAISQWVVTAAPLIVSFLIRFFVKPAARTT